MPPPSPFEKAALRRRVGFSARSEGINGLLLEAEGGERGVGAAFRICELRRLLPGRATTGREGLRP